MVSSYSCWTSIQSLTACPIPSSAHSFRPLRRLCTSRGPRQMPRLAPATPSDPRGLGGAGHPLSTARQLTAPRRSKAISPSHLRAARPVTTTRQLAVLAARSQSGPSRVSILMGTRTITAPPTAIATKGGHPLRPWMGRTLCDLRTRATPSPSRRSLAAQFVSLPLQPLPLPSHPSVTRTAPAPLPPLATTTAQCGSSGPFLGALCRCNATDTQSRHSQPPCWRMLPQAVIQG